MKRIAVLISNKGTGSNLEAILKAVEKGQITNGKVVVVVSDKEDAYGLIRAKKRLIPTVYFPLKEYRFGKKRQKYDEQLARLLKEKYRIDLVVLAGWMLILSDKFIRLFPNKTINLHPGLLPDTGDYITLTSGEKLKAIRGLHTDAAVKYALDHKYPVTGSTVHFITPKVDEGKVIIRSEVRIRKGDTVETLYSRMKKEEHKILPKAIDMYCSDNISRCVNSTSHQVWSRSYTSGRRMKILVIGFGGREHALAWKIAQSEKVEKIYCAPGNPGIGQIAENVPIRVDQLDQLVQFAKQEKIDITFVGPEVPLILGIVDLFQKNKLNIIGPSQKAAQLEGSKVFAKAIMKKYHIPTADFAVFSDYQKATEYLKQKSFPIVIKASGQAAGKGVLVAQNKSDAIDFLRDIMVNKIFGESGNNVVIEEYLEGPEVSFMVATDGKEFVSFLPSQDHKRVFDNDGGPNTGGMGAYAPVPFVDKNLIGQIEKKIVAPTINAMTKEGIPYRGILYPGLILTKDGPKVLEFNCRFGDPETQPLMMLLKTDLIDISLAIKNKRIKNLKLKWHDGSAICVVLTTKGYPGKYETGNEINFARGPLARGIYVFHSGTIQDGNKILTNGGRVLGITAHGNDLQSAMRQAYEQIGNHRIHFKGMHYRKDIGKKVLNSHQ